MNRTCHGDHVILTKRGGHTYRECLCGYKEQLVIAEGETKWVPVASIKEEK